MKLTKPISKKQISPNFKENFITMDIETITNEMGDKSSILTPFLLCWYNGKRFEKHSYFINKNIQITIKNVMKDICIRKYKGYKIYFHNFSKFDGFFLIKYFTEIGECSPIIHKGKIISFNFKPNWKKDFSFTFLDSYLLLPSSLKNLSKSFNVENPKGIFPFKLNDINYKGIIPDIKYFSSWLAKLLAYPALSPLPQARQLPEVSWLG